MSRRVRIALLGAAAAAILVAAAAIVLALPSDDGRGGYDRAGPDCARFRFDRDAWAASAGADPLTAEGSRALDARRRQADALVRCHTLEGLTRSRVRRLLGPTDPRDSERNVWAILVGPSRGFMIDSEYLEVRFRAGRVTGAELVTY